MNPVLRKLHEIYEKESVVEGDVLRFREMGVDVRPEIGELTDNKAILYFHVSCDKWDRELFECSAGAGNSQKDAIGIALFSFAAGFMRGVKWMMRESFACRRVNCDCDAGPQPFVSSFNGREHRWTAYASDGICLGKEVGKQPFWDAVREGVAQRLGNQKVAWIKLFGVKAGDDATGECRINDAHIPELSARLEAMVREWELKETGEMCSYKQFVFLVQDDSTRQPYPHTQEQIRSHTLTALRMFPGFDNRRHWEHAVGETIGDKDLASEICAFVPELCAQNNFDGIEYGETVTIRAADWKQEVYLTQLFAYHDVREALYSAFRSGDVTNDMYRDLIGFSSIWSVICSAKEQGTDITQKGCKISLVYDFDAGYALR